ncbi:MAG: hypothetical protein P8105_06880 [Dehalococcoidia bacterium]
MPEITESSIFTISVIDAILLIDKNQTDKSAFTVVALFTQANKAHSLFIEYLEDNSILQTYSASIITSALSKAIGFPLS